MFFPSRREARLLAPTDAAVRKSRILPRFLHFWRAAHDLPFVLLMQLERSFEVNLLEKSNSYKQNKDLSTPEE